MSSYFTLRYRFSLERSLALFLYQAAGNAGNGRGRSLRRDIR